MRIYENQRWPNFTWDAQALACQLAKVRHSQGRLLGRMEGLGFELRQEASLRTLTCDVLHSSAIEGEFLNPDEVRSSIARRLGVDVGGLVRVGRDVEGVVEMMLDATQQCMAPLTRERLFNWHAALFPTGRQGIHPITVGAWRTLEAGSMQVVSGPIGKETVHFEALPADCLDREMGLFLDWFGKDCAMDPIIKAGIAHFWFVTIHPFEDGNGRIARAIGDMALARADGVQERFYSLSSQIEAERGDYYLKLESQQRMTPDLTCWLDWFLGCFGRAVCQSEHMLEHVLWQARFWDYVNQDPVNERQKKILNRMLDQSFQGWMNTSKYAKMAKCSCDTALRDIQGLKTRGLLIRQGSGRSTSYRLVTEQELRT